MDRCRGGSARSGWSSTQARGRTASGTPARLGRPPAARVRDLREHRAAAEGSGGEEPGYCQEGEGGQGYRRSYCRRYDHNAAPTAAVRLALAVWWESVEAFMEGRKSIACLKEWFQAVETLSSACLTNP